MWGEEEDPDARPWGELGSLFGSFGFDISYGRVLKSTDYGPIF